MKMTTGKAHKAAPAKAHRAKASKARVRGIHIRPSSNGGFSVGHELAGAEPDNRNPYPMPGQSPDPAVFADQAGAHAHVGDLMGRMNSDQGEMEPDADDKVAA